MKTQLIRADHAIDAMAVLSAESDVDAGMALLVAFGEAMKKAQPQLDAHDPVAGRAPQIVVSFEAVGTPKSEAKS